MSSYAHKDMVCLVDGRSLERELIVQLFAPQKDKVFTNASAKSKTYK